MKNNSMKSVFFALMLVFLTASSAWAAAALADAEQETQEKTKKQKDDKAKAENEANENKDAMGALLSGFLTGSDADKAELMKKFLEATGKKSENGDGSDKPKDKESRYLAGLKVMMEKADEARAAEEYDQAALYYKIIASARVEGLEEEKKRAADALAEFETIAADKLREADDLLALKKTRDAVFIYKFISEKLQTTSSADAARVKMAQLMLDKSIASHVRFVDAQKVETAGELLTAVRLYEKIIEEYPKELSALRAQKQINAIRTDPDLKTRYEQQLETDAELKAAPLIEMAKQYIEAVKRVSDAERKSGLKADAQRRLESVIKDYPGTKYETEAKELLNQLNPPAKCDGCPPVR
ncbi:MAG: hypothetical protein ABIH86_03390 [Planctomycetota bacterium]